MRDDIYRFLLPEREQTLAAFVAQYRRVREQDGYRSRPAAYYQSLPDVPPGDPQAPVWRIRAATYRSLERIALPRPASAHQRLTVLDLGAGNAWLCNRLNVLGHACVAVDWLDDSDDGLGAARHYETSITRVQADFDRPPFVPGQFDLVVYNGSLHYSSDIKGSLGHGFSMLRPGGTLAIMDSPTFRSKASAERMVAEQAQRFAQGGPLAEPIRPGQGYLLAGELLEAGHRLGIQLRYTPSRGDLGWALRRQLAGFKLRREPASFGLWLGVKV
jgi:2-polyprenyl-3-methyl-5-hydroxy-6-metoxy-1,4-benzoquinol methylase